MTSHRVGIIALVPEAWSQRWSTRHHVLTRLSDLGPVIWVNPPHEWPQALDRFSSGTPELVAPIPGREFYVYTTPFWLPHIYAPAWFSRFIERWRFGRLRRRLRKMGATKVVLSIWHPNYAAMVDRVAHDMSMYHVDDEYSFSDHEKPLSDVVKGLLARVDQVFVHSEQLLVKNRPYARNIELTPNGAEFHLFADPAPPPSDIMNIPHPRIGYTGWVKKQIDWALVLALATRHPEWSFVIVGRRSPHPEISEVLEALDARPNVYFLGEKPTEELAKYPQHFDVCIMPYRVNDYTKYINPLKLHEYLASGRPTVGPPIPSLVGMPEVEIASTFEDWEAAITRSLSREANSAERVQGRQALARTKDWGIITRRIRECVSGRLDDTSSR